MTAYVALLDGGQREEGVEVRPLGAGRYAVTLRGRTREIDAWAQDDGTLSLLVDGASWSVQLDPRGAATRVHVRGEVHVVEVLDERRLRLRAAPPRLGAPGRQRVAAPIAAKVSKVLARAGDAVREGQGLAVVEALGMHNELKSPKDGTVVEAAVAEGQAIEGGATIAVVE